MKAKTLWWIGGLVAVGAMVIAIPAAVRGEDPFAAGEDALAVKDDDGSSSLRAKKALKEMADDMVMVKVSANPDDADFPNCTFKAKVLKAAKSKGKHFKLMGRGKEYRFAPVYEMTAPAKSKKKRRKKKKAAAPAVDWTNKGNQQNLGACFYPRKTKLILKLSGVDFGKKVFLAKEIYLK